MQVAACVDEEAGTAMKGLSPPLSPAPLSLHSPPPLGDDIGDFVDEGNGTMETNGEEHAPPADAVFSGLSGDLSKYSNLSLDEKRSIVHRISLCPEDALQLLQCWTRRELLQLICAEMGEQRKYTGLTKSKMIERLLKLVSKKVFSSPLSDSAPPPPEKTARKRRKLLTPRQQPVSSPLESPPSSEPVALEEEGDADGDKSESSRCRNLACQAAIDPENSFCKRCSCCICYRYDENKDPSLWLVCAADEPPDQDGSASCGLSCHLSCAVRDERCGIARTGSSPRLDVGFFCAYCNKENRLVGNLRKQLVMARDARRVDLLCKRVYLSHQILWGTEKYRSIQTIVDSAATKLKKEVGPLDKVSVRMARGIVNRLVCGAEIQKLCDLAIEAVDRALSGALEPPPAAANGDSQAGSPVSALGFEDPAVVAAQVSSQRGLTSSGESPPGGKRKRKKKRTQNLNPKKRRTKKISGGDMGDDNSVRIVKNDNSAPRQGDEAAGQKSEEAPKSWRPPTAGEGGEPAAERRYEYCVKVIRWLECEGHMEKEFRVKFLTWFSLKASAQERRVVSAFIDVLVDEPSSLVDQLLDAFKDSIGQPDNDKPANGNLPPKDRLCTRLWH